MPVSIGNLLISFCHLFFGVFSFHEMRLVRISLFESFKIRSLNNSTVAIASPEALCLFVIGIPRLLTRFPSLYDFKFGMNYQFIGW